MVHLRTCFYNSIIWFMKSGFKYIFLSLLVCTATLSSAFAGGKKDKLFDVIENGSYKEINTLIRNHKDYVNVTRGPAKENLLMAALKADRELDVINVLLKYDANPDKKDKNKRNALSYAVQYSSRPEVIERLVKVNNFFDFSKRKRINQKDKNGKNCFDWAKENSNPEMAEKILRKYVKETPVKNEAHTEEIPEEEAENQEEEISETVTASNPASSNTPPVYSEMEKDFIEVTASNPASSNIPPVYSEPEKDFFEVTASNPASSNTPPVYSGLKKNFIEVTVPVSVIPVVKKETEVQVEPEEKKEVLPPAPEKKVTVIPAAEKEDKDEPPAEQKQKIPSSAPVTQVKKVYSSESVPEVKPYTKTYLLDYAEIESDDDPVIEDPYYDSDHIYIENPDSKDISGRTRLMKAAKAGDLKLLDNLIFSKANVNLKDNEGWTALMFAARFSENPEVIKLLIANNADVFAKNNYGITALKLSAGFNKNSEITRLILEKHLSQDNEVRNCFIYAITNGAPVSVIEAFWKKGANLNSIYDGKTPLMYAAETNKDTLIIHWLIKHGAKTTYKSTEGKTAFDYARANKALPKDKIYWSLNSSGAN